MTPAAPEARGDVTRGGGGGRRGRERGLEKATAKSAKPAKPVVAPWSPDEVRARLIDGVAPKLTKQTVVNAMRRAFDVDALASAGLEGNAATMAKRASAAKLCDAYAALVAAAESGARKTETNPNPNPNEEDAARRQKTKGPNERGGRRATRPPPPALDDVPSDSAWGSAGARWRAATAAARRRRRLLARRERGDADDGFSDAVSIVAREHLRRADHVAASASAKAAAIRRFSRRCIATRPQRRRRRRGKTRD